MKAGNFICCFVVLSPLQCGIATEAISATVRIAREPSTHTVRHAKSPANGMRKTHARAGSPTDEIIPHESDTFVGISLDIPFEWTDAA
jgi:hypothetical protein